MKTKMTLSGEPFLEIISIVTQHEKAQEGDRSAQLN